MVCPKPTSSSGRFESRDRRGGDGTARTARRRLVPGAESLEWRTCLSTVAPAIGDRSALLATVESLSTHGASRSQLAVHREETAGAAVKMKRAPAPSTLYVKPGGKLGANAGRSASRPLGSLSKAISMAKPGTTIVLAPGDYREKVTINHKSNITIVGAADQSSVISPSSGTGITVTNSTNITIQNVWFRSTGTLGKGLGVLGASVNLANIKTNDTLGDGVVVASYRGQSATLNAVSSHFDGVQLGSGLDLQGGATATIVGCTFIGDGTSASVGQGASGLAMLGNASANIVNSVFIGNTNNGLAAHDSAQVTARGCTFASSVKGNGAIFLDNSTVTLIGNSFTSNGQVFGPITGFNGVEFYRSFSGSAVVSGNSFIGNTANGLFVGGSPNTIQIVNNLFDDNFFGMTLDAAEGSTMINAVVQGNTIRIPLNSSHDGVGLNAIGGGLTATIGGTGSLGNTFENYTGPFIYIADGDAGAHGAGYPTLTILTNTYTNNGQPVDPSKAVVRV